MLEYKTQYLEIDTMYNKDIDSKLKLQLEFYTKLLLEIKNENDTSITDNKLNNFIIYGEYEYDYEYDKVSTNRTENNINTMNLFESNTNVSETDSILPFNLVENNNLSIFASLLNNKDSRTDSNNSTERPKGSFDSTIGNIFQGKSLYTTDAVFDASTVAWEQKDKYVLVTNTNQKSNQYIYENEVQLRDSNQSVYIGYTTLYTPYTRVESGGKFEYYANFGTINTGDGNNNVFITNQYVTYFYDGNFKDSTNESDASRYTPIDLKDKPPGIYYVIPPTNSTGTVIDGLSRYALIQKVNAGLGNNSIYTSDKENVLYLDPTLAFNGSMWGFQSIYLNGNDTVYITTAGVKELIGKSTYIRNATFGGTVYFGDIDGLAQALTYNIDYTKHTSPDDVTVWNVNRMYLSSGNDIVRIYTLETMTSIMSIYAYADINGLQTNTAYIQDSVVNDRYGMLDISKIQFYNFKDLYLRQGQGNTIYLSSLTNETATKMIVHGSDEKLYENKLIIDSGSDNVYNIFNRFLDFNTFYTSENASFTLFVGITNNTEVLTKDTTIYVMGKNSNVRLGLTQFSDTIYYSNAQVDNIYNSNGDKYTTKFVGISGIQTYYNDGTSSSSDTVYIDTARVTADGVGLKTLSLGRNDKVYIGKVSTTYVEGYVWNGTYYVEPTVVNVTSGETSTSINKFGNSEINFALTLYADKVLAERYTRANNNDVNITGNAEMSVTTLYLTGTSNATLNIQGVDFGFANATKDIEITYVGTIYSGYGDDTFLGNFYLLNKQTGNTISQSVESYISQYAIFWDGGAGNDTFKGAFVELNGYKEPNSAISSLYFNLIQVNNVENILITGSPYSTNTGYIGGMLSIKDDFFTSYEVTRTVSVTADSTQAYKYSISFLSTASALNPHEIHISEKSGDTNFYLEASATHSQVSADKFSNLYVGTNTYANIYLDSNDLSHNLNIVNTINSNAFNTIATVYGNDGGNTISVGDFSSNINLFPYGQPSKINVSYIENIYLQGGNDTVYVGVEGSGNILRNYNIDGGTGIDTISIIQQVGGNDWIDSISSFEVISLTLNGSDVNFTSNDIGKLIADNQEQQYGNWNISLTLDLNDMVRTIDTSFNVSYVDANGRSVNLLLDSADFKLLEADYRPGVDIFEYTDTINSTTHYIKVTY